MKIEIKLENPKYCDGCPCLREDYYNCSCRLSDYPLKFRRVKSKYTGLYGHYIRPQICISENGK